MSVRLSSLTYAAWGGRPPRSMHSACSRHDSAFRTIRWRVAVVTLLHHASAYQMQDVLAHPVGYRICLAY